MKDFDITKPPPASKPKEVGKWGNELFELSRNWRDDELNMPQVWRDNHKLYRGNHWGMLKKKNNVTVNLFFSNVNRTVANITSNEPVSEVVDLDGDGANDAKLMTARLKKWWMDSKQSTKLRTTAMNSEVYGITWEKSTWSMGRGEPHVVVCDPFAIFPYPGYWENVATDCPAICHAVAEEPSVVQKMFDTEEDIKISETYTLLGGEREEVVGVSSYGTTKDSISLQSGSGTKHLRSHSAGVKGEKALVVEVWCRDYSKKPALNENGDKLLDADGNVVQELVYPGGIRCITFTNEGKLVLSDGKNPNINWELWKKNKAAVESNYMFSRFPFWKNNSYSDSTSVFGFSAAEQTAPLNIKVDEIFSRLINYAMRAMTGVMVIPPSSGLTLADLNNKPNLVLFPDTDQAASGIRFVPLPNLPPAIFNVLDTLIDLHDRVHAIQDVDRGQTPKNITAASAIVALQERNAALIQHKINGVDHLVEERGNYAVAQWQMHGHASEMIKVDDEPQKFTGSHLAGKNFNYVVESGSTIAKTSLQLQEQSMDLANNGWIDRQALLEALNYPNAAEILERMAEDDITAAIQLLIQAGLPEDVGMELAKIVSMPQGGPGNRPQEPTTLGIRQPQPGIPRDQQGDINNASA